MKRYKLFHSSVEFCYYVDGVDKIPRTLVTDPRNLIPDLFGVDRDLIDFQTSEDPPSAAWAYVGATNVSTPDFIFAVNGRPIHHDKLKRKLRRTYETLLGVEACRSLYLNLILNPDQVDFNKDPKKSTVGLPTSVLDELSAGIKRSLNGPRKIKSTVKAPGPENRNSNEESRTLPALPGTIVRYQIICQDSITSSLILVAAERIFVVDRCHLTSVEELGSDIQSYKDQFTKMQQTDPGFVLRGVQIGVSRLSRLECP